MKARMRSSFILLEFVNFKFQFTMFIFKIHGILEIDTHLFQYPLMPICTLYLVYIPVILLQQTTLIGLEKKFRDKKMRNFLYSRRSLLPPTGLIEDRLYYQYNQLTLSEQCRFFKISIHQKNQSSLKFLNLIYTRRKNHNI